MKIKRGVLGFQFYFLLIAFGMSLLAFYIYRISAPQYNLDFIGEVQLEMFKSYQKGLNALDYIKMSAGYSMQQAIYELGRKGGFEEPKDCGTYSGFNVWADISKRGRETLLEECYPGSNDVSDGFVFYFDDDIREYLEVYPLADIMGDFQYSLSGNLILTAIAEEGNRVSIPIGGEKFTISYRGPAAPERFGPAPPDATRVSYPRDVSFREDIAEVARLHPEVLLKYEQLCSRMGAEPYPDRRGPCFITSSYRDGRTNREIGGAKNSYHVKGLALDIHVGRGMDEQLRWARAASEAGFTGIGVYPGDSHIHIDLRPGEKVFFMARRGRTLASYSDLDQLSSGSQRYALG